MLSATLPSNETERLAALHSYEVLDTACESTFDNIAHLAATLIDCPISLVSLIDSDRQWFKSRIGLDVAETPRAQSFCAHAILDPTEPLVVPDARLDDRFADNPLVTGGPGIRFYAGMPLINPEGAALGTLCVIDNRPREIGDAHRQILRRLAETVITTLELRRAMIRARAMALVDGLTGLANRTAVMDAIDRAIECRNRHGRPFALLYLDLDGFKRTNNSKGHAIGDSVLREVAASLSSSARTGDLVGRLGGDEFAIVLTDAAGSTGTVAERFRTGIETRMVERGWAITASVGAASFSHTSPKTAEIALTTADTLMYDAKNSGKNRVRWAEYAADDDEALAA